MSDFGGLETVFSTLIENLYKKYDLYILTKSKFPVRFLNLFNKLNIKYLSCNSTKFRGYNILSILYQYWIKRPFIIPHKIRKINPDIIIDYKNGYCSYFSKRLKEYHQIMFEHGYGDVPKISLYDKVVLLTKAYRNEFVELYPKYKDKFVQIYNPIDKDNILKLSNEKIPEKFKNCFISVSRLTEKQKDIKTLIDAYESFVKNTKSKTKLLIIGDGKDGEALENYALTKSSKKQIIFIGKKSNPFAYMKNAKALILSTKFEALGMVLIENLICSNGVTVSSDCKYGPREILLNGKCGCLFQIGDKEKLAKILTDIDCGKITRKQFEKNIQKSLKRFEGETVSKQIEKLIEEQKEG